MPLQDRLRRRNAARVLSIRPRVAFDEPRCELFKRRHLPQGTTSVEAVLDANNLFNTASILTRVTQEGPTYLNPVTIQRGRLMRIGVNVDF